MPDLLEDLHTALQELTTTAAECRADDEFLPAVIAEELAAVVERRIAAIEREEVAA